MTNERKKIIAKMIVTALLFCLVCVFFVGSGLVRTVAEIVSLSEFERSDVMDDLQSASLPDGSEFKLNDYPMSDVRKVEIVNLVEFCFGYSKSNQTDFGVYLYIYNPDGSKLDTSTGMNKVEMATQYDADDVPSGYGKFNLQYLSSSKEQNNANVFYKFKIVDDKNKTILSNANSNYNKHGVRRYDISSVELSRGGIVKDENTAIGGSFKFSGFVNGYGRDLSAECDLKCSVSDQETIALDVRQTFFRPDTISSLGVGHQNTLNSCYFAVPNSMISSYGKLDQIRAEWWEYETSPIIVTASKSMFNEFNAYKGKEIPSFDSKDRLSSGFGFCTQNNVTKANVDFSYAYNIKPDKGSNILGSVTGRTQIDEIRKRVPYLFYTGDNVLNKEFILKGKTLDEYIQNYMSDSGAGFIPGLKIKGKEISNDLFTNTINVGRARGHNLKDLNADDEWNMLSYDNGDKMNIFEKWLNFGFGDIDIETDFKNIKTIEQVDAASNEWYINKNDKNEFVDYVNQKKSENQTTFLFRYAMTDYYSVALQNFMGNTIEDANKNYVVSMRQETVFLRFDIIHLRFCKDGVYKVIPAVSSPQDVFNDLTPPIIPESTDLMAWFAKIWKIVKIALIGVAVLIGLFLLIPIVKLIILPFKLIKKSIDKSYEKSKRKY